MESKFCPGYPLSLQKCHSPNFIPGKSCKFNKVAYPRLCEDLLKLPNLFYIGTSTTKNPVSYEYSKP